MLMKFADAEDNLTIRTQRRFSAEFKAKVALEAIKGHESAKKLTA
jgi:transposase-like protein